MAQAIPLRMGRSQAKTFAFSMGSIFFRYGLMAIPLIAAIKLDDFELFGVIAGLFLIQFVILADQLLIIILSTRAGQKQV